MATGEICKLALEWGLLKCSGKTPEATMASSLYGDIKRNDGASMFFRPSGGMFGLKEWIKQGLFPEWPPEGVPDALDRSQKSSDRSKKGKKKRKNTNSSKLQPRLGAKRQHQAAPSPTRVAVVLQNAAAERKQLEDQNTFETSWQQKPTNNSTNLINAIAPVTTTGMLTAEQPRERLPTSESNEAAGLSAATTAHNYYVPPHVNNNAAVPAELELNQQDWIRSALAEQEIKVAAVENKWGPLHPRAGQAHLLLYKACKQQAIRFPSVEIRALTALTRYDFIISLACARGKKSTIFWNSSLSPLIIIRLPYFYVQGI
jgi:hypothetical protein